MHSESSRREFGKERKRSEHMEKKTELFDHDKALIDAFSFVLPKTEELDISSMVKNYLKTVDGIAPLSKEEYALVRKEIKDFLLGNPAIEPNKLNTLMFFPREKREQFRLIPKVRNTICSLFSFLSDQPVDPKKRPPEPEEVSEFPVNTDPEIYKDVGRYHIRELLARFALMALDKRKVKENDFRRKEKILEHKDKIENAIDHFKSLKVETRARG
jgi:hypothetical protein